VNWVRGIVSRAIAKSSEKDVNRQRNKLGELRLLNKNDLQNHKSVGGASRLFLVFLRFLGSLLKHTRQLSLNLDGTSKF
jgi:hypothetical protein